MRTISLSLAILVLLSFSLYAADSFVILRFTPRPDTHEAALARIRDLGWEILKARVKGFIDVRIPASRLAEAPSLGVPWRIMHDETAPKALDDYIDPSEIELELAAIAAANPDICELFSLGQTYENRDIWCLKLAEDPFKGGKLKVYINSQHHAREIMTPELTMELIRYLVANRDEPRVSRWLENLDIYVVPCVNPDGSMYVFTNNYNWRKNRRPVSGGVGIDPNRNYPFLWNHCYGSSGTPSSDTYRGPSAASELEIQSVMGLMDTFPFVASLSYHTYSELVIYPYGCPENVPAREIDLLETIGCEISGTVRGDNSNYGEYSVGRPYDLLYNTDGDDTSTLYGMYALYPFVLELNNSSFWPDYDQYRDVTVERNLPGIFRLFDRVLSTSVTGFVRDAATGLPLSAEVSINGITFSNGESPRMSNATTGRYYWFTSGQQEVFRFEKNGYYTVEYTNPAGFVQQHKDIYLIPSGQAGIMIDGFSLDDSSGDNDGLLDPGETALLNVRVYNAGKALSQATLTVSTTCPDITLSGSPLQYGAMANNTTAFASSPISITAGSQATDQDVYVSVSAIATPGLCRADLAFTLPLDDREYCSNLYHYSLNNLPDFTIENNNTSGWEYGQPSGFVNQGHTGDHVIATNLSGNYADNAYYRLTMGPYDFSGMTDVKLSCYSLLKNEEHFDMAFIQVKYGDTFYTVWGGYDSATSYSLLEVPLGMYADNNPATEIRFVFNADGYLDDKGWYLDDISLSGRQDNGSSLAPVTPLQDAVVGSANPPEFSWHEASPASGYYYLELSSNPGAKSVRIPQLFAVLGTRYTPTAAEWNKIKKLYGVNNRVLWRVVKTGSQGNERSPYSNFFIQIAK